MNDPARWDRVNALFQQALERPQSDRLAFVREACQDDVALSAEVESLLDAHARAGDRGMASPFDALDSSAISSLAQVLKSGECLGPYEILTPLGFGGMGEVYKARDTRLNRIVAIKVLSAPIGGDAESRARFLREAQAVAALNHPHICTLHDVGCCAVPRRPEPIDFLVMEYLEGETLATRLAKGALPLDHALEIAIQIADALAVAHRSGIVHRDLKPGNVMLLGTRAVKDRPPEAKLLDFGLARMNPPKGAAAPDATSHVVTNLTAPHEVLGTLPYMAPEQLGGVPADARSDIFAFGAVLYEMVCGRAAFVGANETVLLDNLLNAEPRPLHELRPAASPLLSHVVARCLAKEPDHRWQSAQDVAASLRWIAETRTTAAPAAPRGFQRPITFVIAAAVLLATGAFIAWLVRPTATSAPMVRFSIAPLDSTMLARDEAPEVSPDGRQIAFVASSNGTNQLQVRNVDDPGVRVLAGTEGARSPFWSPDSTWIAFFADGQLKRVAAAGGSPQVLWQGAFDNFGGSWNGNDTIIFSPAEESGLFRISGAGGAASRLTTIDTAQREHGHYWPHFLPNGDHFLFAVESGEQGQDGLYVGSLKSGERRLLLPGLSNARYVTPGYLLFTRDRTLLAQRFDPDEQRLIGQASVVAEGVTLELCCGTRLLYSASRDGVLAYRTDDSTDPARLTWFSRDGTEGPTVGPTSRWAYPALSPDGATLAVTVLDNRVGDDIWLFDISRGTGGTGMRFTSEPGWDLGPIWSPDGKEIIFSSDRLGPYNLFRKSSSGVGTEQPVLDLSVRSFPMDWSTDGRLLIYQTFEVKTNLDLWVQSLADGIRTPLRQSPYMDADGNLSPNMRWLAYMSDESGRPEVYIQGFPNASRRWLISTHGGRQPSWRRDGKELIFLADDTLMAVDITEADGTLEISEPRRLFRAAVKNTSVAHQYRMTADGQKFIAVVPIEPHPAQPLITVVMNWAGALRQPVD